MEVLVLMQVMMLIEVMPMEVNGADGSGDADGSRGKYWGISEVKPLREY